MRRKSRNRFRVEITISTSHWKYGLAVSILLVAAILPGATTSVVADPSTDLADVQPRLEELQARLALLSYFGGTSAYFHQDLMFTAFTGESTVGASDAESPLPSGNVGIGTHPAIFENEPTVVSNPIDHGKLVAGSHFLLFGNRCVAYRSIDGGATWSAPFEMPQLTAESTCSDPVLAYAPDGSRVYYAYMDVRPSTRVGPIFTIPGFDILVSYSDNDGFTWTGPTVALDGVDFIVNEDNGEFQGGFQYDKPWIGTHVAVDDDDGNKKGQANSNWVYVTATRLDQASPSFDSHIAFARSGDRAVSWSAPGIIETGISNRGIAVQGSRPAGGLGNEVLVAWYNSGTDGRRIGEFQIRTRTSSDNGGSFGPIVTAVTDSFETPFALGPFSSYHRWWGTMWPDVEIAPTGSAHIVYTHDPEENTFFDDTLFEFVSTTAEDGDIRYIMSADAPYSSWSAPITLNDDGLVAAQGYAALEISGNKKSGLKLHVTWEDHRLSPEVSPNLLYDIFYTTWERKGGWADNSRVTDASSVSSFFVGDYYDITASGDDLVFGIWTDRRHQTSPFGESNVWGARIDDDD